MKCQGFLVFTLDFQALILYAKKLEKVPLEALLGLGIRHKTHITATLNTALMQEDLEAGKIDRRMVCRFRDILQYASSNPGPHMGRVLQIKGSRPVVVFRFRVPLPIGMLPESQVSMRYVILSV